MSNLLTRIIRRVANKPVPVTPPGIVYLSAELVDDLGTRGLTQPAKTSKDS